MRELRKHHETMRAVQAPDIYHGPNCDQHKPRWFGSAEGDKDGAGPIGPTLELAASTFPPGTVVVVKEPICPECGEVPHSIGDVPSASGGWVPGWKCGCDFDWHAWAEETFS